MRRRTMILGAATAAAIPLAGAPAPAQQKVTVRLGHVMPPTHFENIAFEQLAADIAKRSNGRIEMKVFPASQLGSEREQTEQLNLGAIEMHSSGGALQNYAPQLGIWALPFLFKGPEHYDRVMDGPIGAEMREMLLKNSNIRILAYYPNGERMFFNNKRAFTKLEDFKGVKIRVDDQPVSAQIWRALGASPIPIAFAETYSALQAGVVDAGENPPTNIIRMRFYEVGKYVTVTRHSLTTMVLQTNEKWWQGLAPADRQVLTDSITAFVPGRRKMGWEADKESLEELKKLGASISELQNREEFSKALMPLYQQYGERTGSTQLIERIIATP
jgi:TRAP-type transport system periplasmic protein